MRQKRCIVSGTPPTPGRAGPTAVAANERVPPVPCRLIVRNQNAGNPPRSQGVWISSEAAEFRRQKRGHVDDREASGGATRWTAAGSGEADPQDQENRPEPSLHRSRRASRRRSRAGSGFRPAPACGPVVAHEGLRSLRQAAPGPRCSQGPRCQPNSPDAMVPRQRRLPTWRGPSNTRPFRAPGKRVAPFESTRRGIILAF